MRKNARLFGMLIVLALVLLAIFYVDQAVRHPTGQPPGLTNVPPLGQVPTQDQIENRPPPSKK